MHGNSRTERDLHQRRSHIHHHLSHNGSSHYNISSKGTAQVNSSNLCSHIDRKPPRIHWMHRPWKPCGELERPIPSQARCVWPLSILHHHCLTHHHCLHPILGTGVQGSITRRAQHWRMLTASPPPKTRQEKGKQVWFPSVQWEMCNILTQIKLLTK